MEYDLHSRVNTVNCVPPAALAADTNGAAVDTLGFESLEYVIHVGTAFVGGGFDVTLEESDTGAFGGEETAVPAEETLGALPSIAIGDANKTFRVGSIGKKRYQRIVLTETGTISAGVIGVAGVLSHPKQLPVADQST